MAAVAEHTPVALVDADTRKADRGPEAAGHPPRVPPVPDYGLLAALPHFGAAGGHQDDGRDFGRREADDAQRVRQQLERRDDGVQQERRDVQAALVRHHALPRPLDRPQEVRAHRLELRALLRLLQRGPHRDRGPTQHHDQRVRNSGIQSADLNCISDQLRRQGHGRQGREVHPHICEKVHERGHGEEGRRGREPGRAAGLVLRRVRQVAAAAHPEPGGVKRVDQQVVRAHQARTVRAARQLGHHHQPKLVRETAAQHTQHTTEVCGQQVRQVSRRYLGGKSELNL